VSPVSNVRADLVWQHITGRLEPHYRDLSNRQTQLAVSQLRFRAVLSVNEIRVTLMARSFRNNHGLGTEREESVGRGTDQERIGVDLSSGDVLDQIWLEQDSFCRASPSRTSGGRP
jgi:hypothetical protein